MGGCLDTVTIDLEHPKHAASIEALLDRAFGPGRFARAAERLREGNSAVAELCLVAHETDQLRGSVRFWPIKIGNTPALLLGPLAVEPSERGRGIGLALMKQALDKAASLGHGLVILVGDEPYYAKAGFVPVSTGQMIMPGPVDSKRLLVRELTKGVLKTAHGAVGATPAS